MRMMSENDVINLIKQDRWMMDILFAVKQLDLPDWWVCAGFVRSKIWDVLHKRISRTPISDIDVIYFDREHMDETIEKEYELHLNRLAPNLPWSVKNQARMHQRNHVQPYHSSVDAISKFPETATSIGVRLDEGGELRIAAPHGMNDLVKLKVNPTPFFKESNERMEIYRTRIKQKNWQRTWNQLTINLYERE